MAATGLAFPNGSVITPDGSTLIVGESFGADYVAFDIAADATLSNRRVWASVPGTAPDGCALDADGAIWFSDALGSQVVRVLEGGEVTHRIADADADLRVRARRRRSATLFVLCAPAHPSRRRRGQGARRDLHAGSDSLTIWIG